MKPEDDDEDDSGLDLDPQRQGKCVVLKTSTRQTIFLPVVGLVDAASLKPSDLVGVNKDSYLILDTLPAEYDSRVKAMEVRRAQLGEAAVTSPGQVRASTNCMPSDLIGVNKDSYLILDTLLAGCGSHVKAMEVCTLPRELRCTGCLHPSSLMWAASTRTAA